MSESARLLAVAQQLKDKPGHYWRTFTRIEALMGWLKHRGKCVYCGVDLVDSTRMIDGLGTTDHLLPKKKYPDLDFTDRYLAFRDYLNAVPSCDGCNCLKRSWDPNTDGGPRLYERGNDVRLNDDMQKKFIKRAREYIETERERRRGTNAQDRNNWVVVLRDLD